jgi:hypothetical protein
VVKGTDGILFQPCFFRKNWIEWVPRERGGGFAANHDELPPDATRRTDPTNQDRVKFIRPNGNEVVETRNHIGYVIFEGGIALPYLIPMTSSGHWTSRNWMTEAGRQHDKLGRIPLYGIYYRMKTRLRTNQYGSWYVWQIDPEVWVNESTKDLDRGHELREAFLTGQRQIEAPLQLQENDDAM